MDHVQAWGVYEQRVRVRQGAMSDLSQPVQEPDSPSPAESGVPKAGGEHPPHPPPKHARGLFTRRVLRGVIGLGFIVFALHGLFHLFDWTIWGLRSELFRLPREILYPLFGTHDLGGYIAHATVEGLVGLALIVALYQNRSSDRK